MNRRTFLTFSSIVAGGALVPIGVHASPKEAVTLSTLDQINERRLYTTIAGALNAIYLETAVGAPNDDITRNALKDASKECMEGLVKLKLVKDYSIVCDETNNSPEVLAKNFVGFDVFWKNQTPTYGHFRVGIGDTPATFAEVLED